MICERINRLQFRALRVAYGYRGSTPINVMHCETCEPPLRVRMAVISRKCVYRSLANPKGLSLSYLQSCKWALLASSRKTREQTLKRFPLLKHFIGLEYLKDDIYRSEIPPMLSKDFYLATFKPSIDTSMLAYREEEKSVQLQPQLSHLLGGEYAEYLQIFTDGSVSLEGDAVGAGIYIPLTCSKLGYKLPAGVSIFSAEVFAISTAVQKIMDHNWTRSIILTDSLSTLQALCSCSNRGNNYILAELKAQL